MRRDCSRIDLLCLLLIAIVVAPPACWSDANDHELAQTPGGTFVLQQPTSSSQTEADRRDPPLIANNTIIATSYKNNSLPLEEGGDDLLVMLTKESGLPVRYCIIILVFHSQNNEWEVYSEQLPSGTIPGNTTGYSLSLAFCDDTASSGEFFVFLGYGDDDDEDNWIGYFMFDSSDDYELLDDGEFGDIPPTDGLFRCLTAAPPDGNGFCKLIVGFVTGAPITGNSGFEVGNLSYHYPTSTMGYEKEYSIDSLEVESNNNYTPTGLKYLGVVEQGDINDLVILVPGPIFPQDDLVFIYEIEEDGDHVESWDRYCEPLRDFPNYFSRIQDGEKKNIAIVRGEDDASFVRYAIESAAAPVDTLRDYKMILRYPQTWPPTDIPNECELFHMDSGDMSGDSEDDLVVIWKECPDSCELGEYVLKITGISEKLRPTSCEDISFENSFADGFAEGDDIDDLKEPMYIRYTIAGEGYCLSLFYHDNETPTNIRVHVEEFSLQ